LGTPNNSTIEHNMSNVCISEARIESDYLNHVIMQPLSEAVVDTILRQPRDPIAYIAHYLRFYNDHSINTMKRRAIEQANDELLTIEYEWNFKILDEQTQLEHHRK